jgi:hypothetical protein
MVDTSFSKDYVSTKSGQLHLSRIALLFRYLPITRVTQAPRDRSFAHSDNHALI